VNRNNANVSVNCHVRIPSFCSRRTNTTRPGALTEKLAHPFCDETAEIFQREVTDIN
jgi:hypothetical protein